MALDTARESIVLLKNDRNTLPLNASKIKSIAVVGPGADSLDVLLGNYNGTPSAYATILTGIQKRFSNAKINHAIGAPFTETRAVPVPKSVLNTCGTATPGCAAPQSGITSEFFLNNNLSGQPVFTRVDPNVDFLWNNIPPAPGVPVENYSIRWSGSLIAPADGEYRLGAASDGGFRLYLEGKLLIDDWTLYGERGERSFTVPVHLQAGHAYAIKFEYFRRFRESYARLLWIAPYLEDEALAAARKSDIIVAVVGISADLEGEERDNSDPGFFGGDRTDIDLPRTQEHLLQTLASTGKPLVVVLTSGSALAVNWANDHAAAILEAWYPGEEGGTAVADVLSGDYNPAGRLPVTFYKSVAQLPPYTSYSMADRTYRYSTETPLYPFGFGLSYSSFSYSTPAIAHAFAGGQAVSAESSASNSSPNEFRVHSHDAITVSVTVTNASAIPGDEVAELYISHPGVDGAPIRALVGFRRAHLDAHASQTVSFLLTARELSIVNPQGERFVPAGPIELWLGSSQPTQLPGRAAPNGQSAKLTITATTPVPN
jgi:beta-glucosidase